MPEIITEVNIRRVSNWNSMFCKYCPKPIKPSEIPVPATMEAYCSNGSTTVAVAFCKCGSPCEGKARQEAFEVIREK